MQEHEARSRTRGDRLGVTDTPVCERFHGQRLWSPYRGLKAWICGAPIYRAISTYYLVDKCDLHFLECAFFFYRKRAQRDLKSI